MAEISIAIGGRTYALHCRDGEEPRLHQLSRLVAERVDKARSSSPGLTEVRQLLFAALLLADELSEVQAQNRAAIPAQPAQDDGPSVQVLEVLAERLEALGEALASERSGA